MHWVADGALLVGALLLAAAVPGFFSPGGRLRDGAGARRCNVKVVDGSLLGGSELAALLAASTEPVLVQGFVPPMEGDFWPCASVEACFRGSSGDVLVGISTGGAIGAENPELALVGRGQELSVRDYTTALRSRSLPEDAYVFFSADGMDIEKRFAPLRSVFGQLLDAQRPELRRLREESPDLAEAVSNVSMRFALGGVSSGSSWHSHGPALLSVLGGHKTWFIRDPSHTLPTWLEDTWPSAAVAQSTVQWLQAAMMASPTGRADAWLQHIWMCTQSAGELMFVPEALRHAIHNEEETLAISVQVDVLVRGSLLHTTASHGHVAATRLLLEAGADVNSIRAFNGGTPLHHAAFLGHLDVARTLVEAGAELGAKDNRGNTPVQVASDAEVIELLSHGAPSRRKARGRKKAARGA
jgi:hypothetical protein